MMKRQRLLAVSCFAGCGGRSTTVLITRAGMPVEGAQVGFNEADGQIAGIELTDASGVARHDLSSRGWVTIVPGLANLLSRPIDPGSQATFCLYVDHPIAQLGTLRVSLATAFAGATHYQIDAGNGPSPAAIGTPTDLPLYETTVSSADKATVLALALDANEAPLAYALAVAIDASGLRPGNGRRRPSWAPAAVGWPG